MNFKSLKDNVGVMKDDEQRSGSLQLPDNMGEPSVLRKHCFRPAKESDELEPNMGVGSVKYKSENGLKKKYIGCFLPDLRDVFRCCPKFCIFPLYYNSPGLTQERNNKSDCQIKPE